MSDQSGQNQTPDEVVEVTNQPGADVEVTETETSVAAPEFDQETFIAVKGLIQRLSVKLGELREKQKDYKQRLQNILDNDSQLAEFEEQAKQAQIAFKKRKQELMETAEAREAKAKAKEISEEAKDIQESLTNNLLSYFQMTGTSSFETIEGEEREFKLNAKLMPLKK